MNSAEILYGPNGGYCYHGCGNKAGNDGYCDACYADHCLVPPDGTCGFAVGEEDDDE